MSDACKKTTGHAYLVEIQTEQDGQRLDNFLITQLKGVPKSHIYRIVRKGDVRVNKGRIKPDYRLQIGDAVRIPPVRRSDTAEKDLANPGARVLQRLSNSILFEDEGLLILNKPSGIAVHGGSGLSYGVIEALRVLYPNVPFLELVHRLDRDTSGCLMIAKKRSTLRRLHELLRTGAMNKRYLALVKGRWQGGSRTVNASLRKNTLQSGERMVSVDEDGKEAISIFQPHTVYAEASLMHVTLIHGRTHQIRVHAKYINHPVAGDEKYGDDAFNHYMQSKGCKRLFLHAYSIAFQIPETGQKINISAPLSEDLQLILANLTA
jgi:23S rRNA pseudouridine955/2504/2580 synthase